MISVECGQYDSSGFADMEEAIALVRRQGVSNARNAIDPNLLFNLPSLISMIASGFANRIPGVKPSVAGLARIAVHAINPFELPKSIGNVLKGAEDNIRTHTRDSLPNWQPTKSLSGVRMVTMVNGANFYPHTDDYEGLVASLQVSVDGGKKTLYAKVGGTWVTERVRTGDITFFGCDTFSERPRVEHSLTFDGFQAVAFTLGQDPFYTISGKYPSQIEHPEHFPQ